MTARKFSEIDTITLVYIINNNFKLVKIETELNEKTAFFVSRNSFKNKRTLFKVSFKMAESEGFVSKQAHAIISISQFIM